MSYEIPKDSIIESINADFTSDGQTGLYIESTKGDIKLMIDDGQCCCEDFGNLFFETPDDIDKFIGAKILSVENIEVPNTSYMSEYGLDEGGETQLKITTNKGVLQYAVYNAHNGYYSHASIQQVFDKTEETYL